VAASDGRRVLAQTLGGLMARGELDFSEAGAAGGDVLRRNATRLYRL
jgi:hypothetical protein